jgi:ACS family hexuronate transporter-like MFS transporter
VAIISLAAVAHQGWSANLNTIVSDTFPCQAMGSVVEIGGMAVAVGNMAGLRWHCALAAVEAPDE